MATIANAQKNMEISSLFESKERSRYGFSAAIIEGKSLKKYDLTLFKSVTTTKGMWFDELEGMVENDSKAAIDKECGYINGKLYYGFYQFKPENGKYRYIFYRWFQFISDKLLYRKKQCKHCNEEKRCFFHMVLY